jgi:uncharacterized protein YndB with AHSA1/START domain
VIRAQGGVRISAPREMVFDYVADARNEPRWLPGARAVDKTDPGPVGLGSTFRGDYARAGPIEIEIVQFERPTRLTFRGTAKGMTFDDAISFSEEDGATTLSAEMTTEPRGLFKLLAPLVGRTIRKQFAANWVKLKEAIESAS